MRPFRRVLIANRGEIAVRIIRACQELGIETVAVHSAADVGAVHARLADRSVFIGPAPASESYLRGDAIVAVGLEEGADAIHPGYGFLAERASFARAVEESGVVFIGPSSATIGALGDKLAARRAAQAADVPVVPGTYDAADVDRPEARDALLADAERIGFPLLVKAAAGGGGRGMRRVERSKDLPAALSAGSAEARSAFGDGSVYMEREIHPARHIEVQLLGDRAGTIVALGERDCSLQRRHQKLIEEAPAPGLTSEERRDLHAVAVRAARASGLENAATAEFLFDEDRRFWFLEVNTRLQVEHGVTELVADVDIVREQIWIAAGFPLSDRVLAAAERATAPERHAFEARLSAEDPARDFAPAPGTIGRWEMPAGPGIRVDTAVEAGSRVPPDYDPMIAKVLVVDETRDAALGRMARALDEIRVEGIQTTLPFDRFIVRHDGFRAGALTTDWVDQHWAAIAHEQRAAALDVARHIAVAAVAASATAADGAPLANRSHAHDRPAPGLAWRRAGRLQAIDRAPR
ncbi:MAG TPA: biotin carboxylase N-terminal domain-containing protein [Patescibacteria group bacterium]|nr:biotin carboxylase N-terminal domain-containing protein [Patescibacteria group bacterium]